MWAIMRVANPKWEIVKHPDGSESEFMRMMERVWLETDEYEAARQRGEVVKVLDRTDTVPAQNDVRPATAEELGLTRKDIHEARQIRDAG